MHPARIRPAVIADAPGIARVHWDSHQTTYVEPGRVSRERVEAWTMADRIARWTANLAIANDVYPAPDGFHRMAIWVAVVGGGGGGDVGGGEGDGEVVGWANTSAGREPDRPRDLELEGLYVLDAHHGTGVGQALLDAAIGARPAYLWALAENPRAHAFYRRNGFVADGAEKVDELWQVTEVRFVR
jgi:GNAT superfamily N-acetyltransferase